MYHIAIQNMYTLMLQKMKSHIKQYITLSYDTSGIMDIFSF